MGDDGLPRCQRRLKLGVESREIRAVFIFASGQQMLESGGSTEYRDTRS